MKILLFNDNPVVRKLVALSAQKTKDELSVVWSVDEIQESDYDLLIIDDAMYNDEMFSVLKESITYKSTLLMATRGQAVPLGFDHVIHKPFLPTDLVDMFIQIEKKISSAPVVVKEENAIVDEPVSTIDQESFYAINLEESLPDLVSSEDNLELDDLESFDLGELENEIDLSSDDLDLDGFDTLEEENPQTTILDKEEVQEVQNLLDDTEGDDWNADDELIEIKPIEESLTFDEEEFGGLLDAAEPVKEEEPDGVFGEIESSEPIADAKSEEDELFDEEMLLEEDKASFPPELEDDEALFDETLLLDDDLKFDISDDLLLNDSELDDLETQIENAVNTLESETLESTLDIDDLELGLEDSLLEEFELPDEAAASEDLEDFDPFDSLNERELKQAIGEEVEEEIELHDESPEFLEELESLDPLEELESLEQADETPSQSIAPSHAEGVEALQALLKALSNEEVAKSLKGLNISININFGNEQ